MADERTQRLVQSRHYCIDRLAEVKEDLSRLQAEGLTLKTKLEASDDEVEAGQIRRRRRFLNRRLDELKAERTALSEELQTSTLQLNTADQKPSDEWRPVVMRAPPIASPPSDQ